MKKVREIAEKMAVSDPQIRGISRYLSPIEFDEVFWKNLPNLETDQIRLDLLELAARELLRLRERSSREMSAPGRLRLKPLASAIKTIIEGDGDDAVAVLSRTAANTCCYNRLAGDKHTAARRRAAEIVGGWAESIPHLWNGKGLLLHPVNVLITARHPQTKEMCESPIRVVGDGRGRHDHTSDEGEILHLELTRTTNHVNNLSWKLEESFDQRRRVTRSTLRLAGRLAPSNVQSDFHSEQWEEEFDTYEQVVRKLADGWQPIGFVGMSSVHSEFDGGMHPEAFEIELQITASQLDDCLYRCSKIRLARALEKQWGWRFECTEAYFDRGLDSVMIQSASDELRARLGPPPYWHRAESVPLVSVGKRDTKLVARDGVITFESVPGRH
jgi:hypothetical protein